MRDAAKTAEDLAVKHAATRDTSRPWASLPDIDPDPNSPMCGAINGRIICCRSRGHAGKHATPFPSYRRSGPVWVYWMCGGPFGSCHEGDPETHLYCGLERGHDGPHLSPSNISAGATLAEWLSLSASAPPPGTRRGREGADDVSKCIERHGVMIYGEGKVHLIEDSK